MDDREKDGFWGWCECECYLCSELSEHHLCADTSKCGMPKSWDKNEKPRSRAASAKDDSPS